MRARTKLFWPCGGSSGEGCGQEVWGHIGMVVRIGAGRREVFHLGCGRLKKARRLANG